MARQEWMKSDQKFGIANMETGEIVTASDIRALKYYLQDTARYSKTDLSNIRFYSDCERAIKYLFSYYEKCFNHFERVNA